MRARDRQKTEICVFQLSNPLQCVRPESVMLVLNQTKRFCQDISSFLIKILSKVHGLWVLD